MANSLMWSGSPGPGELTLSLTDTNNGAYVPGQPMTFPMKSAGTLEAVGARLIQACRDRGDMNDPDCALRIKRRLDSCVRQMPGVFDTEAIYNQYTRAYEKCLLTAK